MKGLVGFAGTLLITVLQSAILSALFCLIQWLLSLTGLCSIPSWHKFLFGGLALFCFLFLLYSYNTIITLYRYHKDSVFREANIRTGISWRDYKRLRNKSKQINEHSQTKDSV